MEQPFERSMTVHVIVKTKDTKDVIDVSGWLDQKNYCEENIFVT